MTTVGNVASGTFAIGKSLVYSTVNFIANMHILYALAAVSIALLVHGIAHYINSSYLVPVPARDGLRDGAGRTFWRVHFNNDGRVASLWSLFNPMLIPAIFRHRYAR